MKDRVTNDELAKAKKEAEAMLKVLSALRQLKDEQQRALVLKAVAILYGAELPP